MELYEAMSTQRAVRRLRPDPIPEDVLKRVLTAATWAPSGGNLTPWRIVLVRDPDKKQALEDLYRPHWEGYAPRYRERIRNESPEVRAKGERVLDAGDYIATHMHAAPVIAVFCFNPDRMTITDDAQGRPSVVGGGSVYPAVQNLLLAARSEGLGCVLTTLLCREEADVKALLKIPGDWFTCAHIPLGYPVGRGHGPISRPPVTEMVFEDEWSRVPVA